MDDGSIKSSRHRALILNTQGFTKAENLKLIEILQRKFGIQAQLRPQRKLWQIYLNGSTIERFVEIIKPYMLPSMWYKLGKLGNTIA